MKALGSAAGGEFFSTIYQPMIKVGKGKDKKMIPDPHYPGGQKWTVQNWLAFAIIAIGGIVLLSAFISSLGGLTQAMQRIQKGSVPDSWMKKKPFGVDDNTWKQMYYATVKA